MDKDAIGDEFKEQFFSPIFQEVMLDIFEKSGIYNPEDFAKEAMINEKLQAEIKYKLSVGLSRAFTELGLQTAPDDIEILITEKGIDVLNLKIHQNKDDNSSSNLE